MGISSEILPYRIPHIRNRKLEDPHVVIVGAGASIAACRYDKNGIEVPVLKNIHKVLGLETEVKKHGVSVSDIEDFEMFYSNIATKPEYKELVIYLENAVRDYFKGLELPDKPTYYDYLILSLTEKDAIISFNWDPFLSQAYRRNLRVGNLPMMIFPHGNVGMGICENCHTISYADTLCPECRRKFDDMPLLFPVGKKDYGKHSIIKFQWKQAQELLAHAAGVTVFGYSAPVTDREAVNILKNSYQMSNMKRIALFEIINLKSVKKEQTERWRDLFDNQMMVYTDSFEKTQLWRFPRVSLEALFDAILQCHPREETKSFQSFKTLEDLQNFVETINEFELYFETRLEC